MRFGAGFWGAYPLGRYVEYATVAEDRGFDVAWIGDTQLVTPDLYSTMALCAHATSTILIGSGVTNSVTRDPTVTAGAMLALNEFSNGRCILGIGVGGSAVYTVGLPEDRLQPFRRKLEMLRQLVHGKAVEVNGVEVRPKFTAPPLPIYVASSSPLVLELAGELADGVILNVGVVPELVREALRYVERGARRADRDLRALDVTVIAASSVSQDRGRAIEECRSWAATTTRRIAKWMAAAGAEARAAGAGILQEYRWADHLVVGAAHARQLTDDMASKFVLAGTPADLVQTIKGLEECGVTHVIALFIGRDIKGSLAAFGQEVLPVWRKISAVSAGSSP